MAVSSAQVTQEDDIMTMIGFNFTKINVSKHGPAKGNISINRKCNPTKVEEVGIGSGQKALKYTFQFAAEYKPKVAEMLFEGTLTELTKPEDADEALKLWKEKNQLPPKTLERVMNAILNRCHIEALIMAKEMNIPPPFNLPKIKVNKKEEAKPKKKAAKKA